MRAPGARLTREQEDRDGAQGDDRHDDRDDVQVAALAADGGHGSRRRRRPAERRGRHHGRVRRVPEQERGLLGGEQVRLAAVAGQPALLGLLRDEVVDRAGLLDADGLQGRTHDRRRVDLVVAGPRAVFALGVLRPLLGLGQRVLRARGVLHGRQAEDRHRGVIGAGRLPGLVGESAVGVRLLDQVGDHPLGHLGLVAREREDAHAGRVRAGVLAERAVLLDARGRRGDGVGAAEVPGVHAPGGGDERQLRGALRILAVVGGAGLRDVEKLLRGLGLRVVLGRGESEQRVGGLADVRADAAGLGGDVVAGLAGGVGVARGVGRQGGGDQRETGRDQGDQEA